MGELNITIGGQSFPHLLYHFVPDVLELGGRVFVKVIRESFESLSDGLQKMRWWGTGWRTAGPPDRPDVAGGE